jgi:dTDP-4-dehydrorhamnose 3,5-epimerase
VVDMREGSSTWGRWKSFTLAGGASSLLPEQQSLVVPKGFAHGFQAVTANVTVLYEQDGLWNKEDERGFNPLDPEVGIGWESSTVRHRLSEKDAGAPGISVFA